MDAKIAVVKILETNKQKIKNPQNWWNGVGECGNRQCAATVFGNSEMDNTAFACLDKTCQMMGYNYVPTLNDSMGHASVMTLFDLSIAFVREGIVKVNESGIRE